MLPRFMYAAAPPAATAPAAPANMASLPQRCQAGTAAASTEAARASFAAAGPAVIEADEVERWGVDGVEEPEGELKPRADAAELMAE